MQKKADAETIHTGLLFMASSVCFLRAPWMDHKPRCGTVHNEVPLSQVRHISRQYPIEWSVKGIS